MERSRAILNEFGNIAGHLMFAILKMQLIGKCKVVFFRIKEYESLTGMRFERTWEGPDPTSIEPSENDPTYDQWHAFYVKFLSRFTAQR